MLLAHSAHGLFLLSANTLSQPVLVASLRSRIPKAKRLSENKKSLPLWAVLPVLSSFWNFGMSNLKQLVNFSEWLSIPIFLSPCRLVAKLSEWIQQVIVHVFMQISSHFGLRAFGTQVYFLKIHILCSAAFPNPLPQRCEFRHLFHSLCILQMTYPILFAIVCSLLGTIGRGGLPSL